MFTPVRIQLFFHRTGLVSDWLFEIPPRPLVSPGLAGFRLLSGTSRSVQSTWAAWWTVSQDFRRLGTIRILFSFLVLLPRLLSARVHEAQLQELPSSDWHSWAGRVGLAAFCTRPSSPSAGR